MARKGGMRRWQLHALTMTLLTIVLSDGAKAVQPLESDSLSHITRSESRAFWYSAAGTALPIALGGALWMKSGNAEDMMVLSAGGIVVGPSLGYLYAGSPGRGLIGIGMRGAALAVGSLFLVGGLGGGDTAWVVGGLCGVGLTVASAVHDIRHVPEQVRKNNRRDPPGVSLYIAPIYLSKENVAGIGLRAAWK